MKKQFRLLGRKAQKGFTLIELAIVGLFLGILVIFSISQFGGSATDATKSQSLYEASQKLGDNWSLLAQSCGTSSDVTALNMNTGGTTTPGAGNLSVLVGNLGVFATYSTCYNSSGIRPLAGLTVGATGAEKIQGYLVTLGKGTTATGASTMTVTVANVPTSLVTLLFTKYGSGVFAAGTANTTDPQVQYSAAAAGVHNVTIVRAL